MLKINIENKEYASLDFLNIIILTHSGYFIIIFWKFVLKRPSLNSNITGYFICAICTYKANGYISKGFNGTCF